MEKVILFKLNRFLFFTDQQFPVLPSSSINFLTSISTFFTAIPNFFISIFTVIFNFFSSIFTAISNFFTSIPNFFGSILTPISNFFTSIPNFFSSIFQHIGQFFTEIPNLITSLLHKLDEAVPPETRIRILTITSACVAVIILLILLYCFFTLIISFIICVGVTCLAVIRSIFMCLQGTCCWLAVTCSDCCGPATGVLMKAPGTGGLVMSRALFEGAPKAFFAASRAGGQLVVRAGQVVSFPGA